MLKISTLIKKALVYLAYKGSSVGEWLGHSLAVLGLDGSSLLTASQRYDGLNSSYAYLLGSTH